MEQFPPNSKTARTADRGPKRVKRVVSATAVRRRKPLGKQFRATFFGGDARTAWQYMITETVVPSIQEMILEAFNTGIERLVMGDRRRPRARGIMANPLGHVQYNQPTSTRYPTGATRMMPRSSRARLNFDDIIITTRTEAEEVLDRMYDLLSKYDSVTVADLYELTGLESAHTDIKWGWTDLRGAGVGRIRSGGYLLQLPEPESLT